MLTRALILILPLLAVAQPAEEATKDTWAQFRGPQASGLATGTPTVTEWDLASGKHVLWKQAIPGLAHASPIVWGERIYLATAVGPGEAQLRTGLYGDITPAKDGDQKQQWRLLALDRATGKILWDQVAHQGLPKSKRHTKATHCNSTPATDGKRIVAIFGSEGLFCFDMDGKLLWKKDLGPMDAGYFKSPAAQWGFASSPVIHGDRVVVQCDVQKGSFIAAYALADGKQLWRTAREEVPTWGSPTIARVGEAHHVLVNGWKHIGAYDLATGKEVWKLRGGGDIPTPTPIVAHGFVYQTSAHGRLRPLRAIRLTASGDITPPDGADTNQHIAWSHPRKGNYMQTPIVVGDLLFACMDNGILTCLDARSGKIHYSQRVGKGGHTASPVSDGKHVYFPSEKGRVAVVAVDKTFNLVATNALGESILATPAISRGVLYIRTEKQLFALGK